MATTDATTNDEFDLHKHGVNEENLIKSLEILLSNLSSTQRIQYSPRITKLLDIFKMLKTKSPSELTLTDITPFFKTSKNEPLNPTATNIDMLGSWNTDKFRLQLENENFHREITNTTIQSLHENISDNDPNYNSLRSFIQQLVSGITVGRHLFVFHTQFELASIPEFNPARHVELTRRDGSLTILTIDAKTRHKDQHRTLVLAQAAATHAYNWHHHAPTLVTHHILLENELVTIYKVESEPSGDLIVTIVYQYEHDFPSPKPMGTDQVSEMFMGWESLCRDLFQVIWMGAKSACEALEEKSLWDRRAGDSQVMPKTEPPTEAENATEELVTSMPVMIGEDLGFIDVEAIKRYIVILEQGADRIDPAIRARLRAECEIDPDISFSSDPDETPTHPNPDTQRREPEQSWEKAKGVAERVLQEITTETYTDSFSSLTTDFVNALPENAGKPRFYY